MIDFKDLDTDFASTEQVSVDVKKEASVAHGGERKLHSCLKCDGTGYVRKYGRSYRCFGCDGKGKTTAAKNGAVKAKVTREQNRVNALELFESENPGVKEFLEKAAGWSDFYGSLSRQLNERGSLSERQVESIRSGMAKIAAKDAERAAKRNAERDAKSGEVDISAIERLFATATDNDIKHPIFRAEGVDISKAPSTGVNAGALYVKSNDGVYLGKIIGGEFKASRDATDQTLAAVRAVALDPTGEAIKYGRLAGRCGCCGKQLVDPVSIRAAIGPICAEKWGLNWLRAEAADSLEGKGR